MHHWDTFSSPQDEAAIHAVIDTVFTPIDLDEGVSCKSDEEEVSHPEDSDEENMTPPPRKKPGLIIQQTLNPRHQ